MAAPTRQTRVSRSQEKLNTTEKITSTVSKSVKDTKANTNGTESEIQSEKVSGMNDEHRMGDNTVPIVDTEAGEETETKEIEEDKTRCRDCSNTVFEEEQALTCDICMGWFHIAKSCQNVPQVMYDMFNSDEGLGGIHWFCTHCNRGASNVFMMMNRISEDMNAGVKALKEHTKRIDVNVAKLAGRVTQQDQKIKKTDKLLEEVDATNLRKNMTDLTTRMDTMEEKTKGTEAGAIIDVSKDMEAKIQDLREEENRKQNLLIYNIKESEETDGKVREQADRNTIIELCTGPLGIQDFSDDNILKVARLGKKQDEMRKPRPVLMRLDSTLTKFKITSNTRHLATAEEKFSCLSIQPDLTKSQREHKATLIEEAKKLDEEETSGNFVYRVRGPPGNMKIRKLAKKT